MKAISLPEFSVGETYFRFLCYSRTSGKFRLSHDFKEDDELLFLGADLINSTLHNNFHIKYWNKGLCIKISFKDAIIKGIPNSKSLWFYTVQGVVQYAFEHLSISLQKDIITSLLEYWLRSDSINTKLPKKLDVPLDLIEGSNASSENVADVRTAHETYVVFHTLNPPDLPLESQNDTSATELTEGDDVIEDVLHHDRVYQNELTGVDLIADRISTTIQTIEDDKQRLGLLQALHVTCSYFESQMPRGPASFFPFNILETYLDISRNGSIASENRHDIILYIVSSWLGKEFLRLKNQVQDEVAAFKQQYIHQLDQLPKPKALVQELFPACMVELLERWLGVGNEQISQEHNYIRNYGQDGSRRKHSYPIIQLMLEFANETLILGMSHALYAQLASMPE